MILVKNILTNVCNVSNTVCIYNKCSIYCRLIIMNNNGYYFKIICICIFPYLIKIILLGKAMSFTDFSDPTQIFQRTVTCKNFFLCESKAYKLSKTTISPLVVK